GLRSKNCSIDLPSRSSHFILAAEAKRKTGRSNIGSRSVITCLAPTIFGDRWSWFRAKQTKIELDGSERFGKTSAFSLQEIFHYQSWRRYLKPRSSSDTTAEFRSLRQRRARIAFCFSVRPIRRFGRLRMKRCK